MKDILKAIIDTDKKERSRLAQARAYRDSLAVVTEAEASKLRTAEKKRVEEKLAEQKKQLSDSTGRAISAIKKNTDAQIEHLEQTRKAFVDEESAKLFSLVINNEKDS